MGALQIMPSKERGNVLPLAMLPALLAASALAQDRDDRIARLAALESRLAELETEIGLLEDTKAIKRLQRAYGYYLDKGLWSELGELFADDPETSVEYADAGVYVGKDRVREYMRQLVDDGREAGQLFNYMIMQGVVNVAADGLTAKGRWRALIQVGQHGESAVWVEGPYENEYIKEDGTWKFHKIHWYQTLAAPYEPGWHFEAIPMAGIVEDFPPDRPPTEVYESYPGAYLPPYHYANPVSGRCEPGVCREAGNDE